MRFTSLAELDSSEGAVRLREASSAENGSDDEVILYPKPSLLDPDDPLLWHRWKKHMAFAAICAFTFLTNFGIGGLAPAFYVISQDFDKPMMQTSELLSWPVLVLGIFNFFWVPLANYYGKRPIFVFTSLTLTASFLLGAVSSTFQILLWSNIAAAFAGSSTETLGAAVVNDMYFLHERGTKMSIYMNAISAGNSLGPLVCGFIVEALGWRWHKWIAAILSGINFIAICLLVPETTSERKLVTTARRLHPGVQDDGSWVTITELVDEATLSTEPDSGAKSHVRPGTSGSRSKRKSYIEEMNIAVDTTTNTRNLGKMFLRPWPLVLHPAVIFAFLGYAVSLAWVLAVNILNPFVLQATPYSWSPQKIGLINIPGFFGNVLGAFVGGWRSDRFCDRATRRNSGIYSPESRLIVLAFPTVVTIAGCLVFGFGVEQALHWTALFVGYGMISVALTAVPTITLTYVSDCVLPINADALMLVNGLKNVVAFGFLYGIVPWVDRVGYVNCFGTQAAIFGGIVGGGAIIFVAFGARMRHVAAQWRIVLT